MKLKKSFIYGISILCLACFATGQDAPKGPPPEGGQPGRPPGGPQGGGDGANRLAEFIKRADSDGDGKISKDEFANLGKKESEDRFGKMDANSDGFVDQAEIGSMAQRMQGQGGQGMRRPEGGSPGGEGGFRRPPGGEGERPKGAPEGDRPKGAPEGDRPKGSPEGMRPGGEGGQRGGGMFGDPKEMFKRMDADANGSVSEDEYIKATEKMREMMRSRGGQPGQPGQPGMRRPEGGAPGGEGGFRRPPTEGDAPKAPDAPAPDKPKDAA